MNRTDEIKERIDSIDKEAKCLMREKGELRDELALILATLKVGDIVDHGRYKYKISRVEYDWRVKYYGLKIKKNGEPGVSEHKLYFIND